MMPLVIFRNKITDTSAAAVKIITAAVNARSNAENFNAGAILQFQTASAFIRI